MPRKRKNRNGVLTGYCMPGMHRPSLCPERVTNPTKPNGVTLCMCQCHGDLDERLRSVGQYVEPDETDEENLEESAL